MQDINSELKNINLRLWGKKIVLWDRNWWYWEETSWNVRYTFRIVRYKLVRNVRIVRYKLEIPRRKFRILRKKIELWEKVSILKSSLFWHLFLLRIARYKLRIVKFWEKSEMWDITLQFWEEKVQIVGYKRNYLLFFNLWQTIIIKKWDVNWELQDINSEFWYIYLQFYTWKKNELWDN